MEREWGQSEERVVRELREWGQSEEIVVREWRESGDRVRRE